MRWVDALKEYNKNKSEWCIPKKGSAAYDEVKNIFAIGKQKEPLPLEKPKTVLKKKTKTEKKPKMEEVKKIEEVKIIEDPKSNIVNNWNDNHIGLIVDQNDDKLYDTITDWVKRKTKKNKKQIIIDSYFTTFFKDYNDAVIEKYGAEGYFKGLDNIISYLGGKRIVNPKDTEDIDLDENEFFYKMTFFDKDNENFLIPKGTFKQKNRKKINNEYK